MTMDFAMDQCLQSDARQSRSLDADWINNETGKKRLPMCKGYAVFYFGVFRCQ